ncbi:MAG: hypothetical protein QXO76_01255 [Thermoproteota archaeon]
MKTVKINNKLHHSLKIISVEENIPLQFLIERVLDNFVRTYTAKEGGFPSASRVRTREADGTLYATEEKNL